MLLYDNDMIINDKSFKTLWNDLRKFSTVFSQTLELHIITV